MRRTFQDELLQGLDEEENQDQEQVDVEAEAVPEYTTPEPVTETELPEEPESKMQRYSSLLQRAATAGPSEEDYRRAAIRRAFAKTSASTPDYLAIMSKTLYNQPDFSGLAAAKRAGLGGKDYGIQAKEAEQRGLEGQAEALRKELLLPAEMADKESKALAVQAKLEQLKPASAEEIAAAEEALGVSIPPNTTKADLAKMTGQATTQAIRERGTPLSDTARKVLEKSLSEKAGEAISLEGISKEEADTLNRAFSQGRDKGMTEYQKLRLEQSQANIELQKSKEESRKEQRDEGKTKTFSKFMNDKQKQYEKVTQKSRDRLADAELIIEMADTNNWAKYAAVAPRMAKAIGGDSGVLTDKDIKRYSSSPQIAEYIIDNVKTIFTGTPTAETKGKFAEAAKEVGNMLKRKMAEEQKKYKESIKKDRLFKSLGGTDEEIDQQIFGGELLYKDQETPAPAPAPATGSTKTESEREELERLRQKFGGRK